jgi:hypothetical protein
LCDHYCSEKLINNQYNQLFLIQKYAFSAVSDLNRHKPNAYALNRFPGLERLGAIRGELAELGTPNLYLYWNLHPSARYRKI